MASVSVSSRINYVDSGLSTGVSRSEDGVEYYYGFEEVRDDNFDFWDAYAKTSRLVASACDDLCDAVATGSSLPPYHNGFSKVLNCSTEEKWQSLVAFIQAKGWRSYKEDCTPGGPFGSNGVADGINGMESVLRSHYRRLEAYRYGIRDRTDDDRKVFMVYLSRVPIEKRHVIHVNLREASRLPVYSDIFGHIVMSFVFHTGASSNTTSHEGIFRNPLSFLNREERYKGISMQLHGFAAAVVQSRFEGKTHMWTTPLRSMTLIMYRHFGPDHVQIDDRPIGTPFREDEIRSQMNVIIALEKLANCYFSHASTSTQS